MTAEAETSYDFDAPMFVDFSNRIEQQDSDIDKWFDNRNGDEGGFEFDSLEEDNDHNADTAIEQPNNNQQLLDATEDKDTSSFCFFENKTAPNLVVVPPWKPRLQALQKVVATSAKERDEPPSKKKKAEPCRATANSSAPRRSVNRSVNRLSGKSSRGFTRDNKAPTRSTKPMPKMKAAILTIPSTPTMMRRMKTTKSIVHKPREQQQLETINKMQINLKQKRKENEDFMKKALSAGNYMPHRSDEDNLTQAHEFKFELDKRIKKPQNNLGEGKEKNFFETLRQHPISPSFKNRKPTKQQPFSFQTNQSRKRKAMDEEVSSNDGYMSMAQQCYKFQHATPPRFRTKNSKDQNTSLPHIKEGEKHTSKITCPRTPNLSSKDRKRPLPDDCLSKEQQEERDVEEMRNYKFKAQPFDSKIVEKQGTYGLKPQTPKTLTEQQPFNFASDQRIAMHKEKEEEVEEKPVPFKAQPIPEFDKIKFKPELPHSSTKQEPFSFEKRDKETVAKKEEKIQVILEEEKKAREFHAQPLQSFSPVELPSISKPSTKFEPFSLSSENRGALKAKKWKEMVEEELHEQRKKAVFKAHSSNVLYQAPFVPKKSLRPNTTFEEFNLNSERRAQDRAVYEMNKREKELQDEQLMLQREAEREEEEQMNIAMLRKQLVHKANPIRTYKQVPIASSDKPLTQPESPAWNTREKRNMRV